jgi:hypothetical protein
MSPFLSFHPINHAVREVAGIRDDRLDLVDAELVIRGGDLRIRAWWRSGTAESL